MENKLLLVIYITVTTRSIYLFVKQIWLHSLVIGALRSEVKSNKMPKF